MIVLCLKSSRKKDFYNGLTASHFPVTNKALAWLFIYRIVSLAGLKLQAKMVPQMFSNLLGACSRWARVWHEDCGIVPLLKHCLPSNNVEPGDGPTCGMGRMNGPLLLVLPRPLPAISALEAVALQHPSPNFEGSESPTRAPDARNLGYKGSRGWAGEPRTSEPWSGEGHWLGEAVCSAQVAGRLRRRRGARGAEGARGGPAAPAAAPPKTQRSIFCT